MLKNSVTKTSSYDNYKNPPFSSHPFLSFLPFVTLRTSLHVIGLSSSSLPSWISLTLSIKRFLFRSYNIFYSTLSNEHMYQIWFPYVVPFPTLQKMPRKWILCLPIRTAFIARFIAITLVCSLNDASSAFHHDCRKSLWSFGFVSYFFET